MSRRSRSPTKLARAVVLSLPSGRLEPGQWQTVLARQLGMRRSIAAPSVAGDHEPSFSALQRGTWGFGIDYPIDITAETSDPARGSG